MFKFFEMPFYMDVDDKGGTSGDDKPKDEAKIDWTKVNPADIPEDLLKKNSAYKEVLDETINRRKELKILRDTINKLNPLEDKQDEIKPDQPKNEDVPAWAQSIITEFNNLKTTNVSTWRGQAGRATGLKGAVLNTLEGTNYGEILAKATLIATELGITAPSPDLNAGNPALERDKGLFEKVKNKMLGKDALDTFSPDVQRSLGGGVILDS